MAQNGDRSSINDGVWNPTQLQKAISSRSHLNRRTFLQQLIQVPYSAEHDLDYPLLNHDFLVKALDHANFTPMSEVNDFVIYLLGQTTSAGADADTVPLSKVACACIGLEEKSTVEDRCSKLRDVITQRSTFFSEREPEEGVLSAYLFDFVTDKNILHKYYRSYENENGEISYEDLRGIICLHPGLFPGLLAGVSKAEGKKAAAAAEKTPLYKDAVDAVMDDDEYGREGASSSSRSTSCVCCMYIEWALCFIILAFAAAAVLAGNWAVAQMFVRDSNFSEAGAYWTTSAIDCCGVLCFAFCWMQCCRSNTSVCRNRQPGSKNNQGAYDLLETKQLLGKIRTAITHIGNGSGGGSGLSGSSGTALASSQHHGGRIILSSHDDGNGDSKRKPKTLHFGMPKWAQPTNDSVDDLERGSNSLTDTGNRMQSPGDSATYSTMQRLQQRPQSNRSNRSNHSTRSKSSKSSYQQQGQRKSEGINNGMVTQKGALYLWRRGGVSRYSGKWEKEKRESRLIDLRNAVENKRKSRKGGNGKVVADMVLISKQRGKKAKNIEVTTTQHVEGFAPESILKNAPHREYCFGLVNDKDRNYWFSAETSHDRDQWMHSFSRLIGGDREEDNDSNRRDSRDQNSGGGGGGRRNETRNRKLTTEMVVRGPTSVRRAGGVIGSDEGEVITSESDDGSRRNSGELDFNYSSEQRDRRVDRRVDLRNDRRTDRRDHSPVERSQTPDDMIYNSDPDTHWSAGKDDGAGRRTSSNQMSPVNSYDVQAHASRLSYDDHDDLDTLENMLDDDSQWN